MFGYTIRGKSYLLELSEWRQCNHSTFSQAILKCVAEVELPFGLVHAIVSDSSAYCEKAQQELLPAGFLQSTHV